MKIRESSNGPFASNNVSGVIVVPLRCRRRMKMMFSSHLSPIFRRGVLDFDMSSRQMCVSSNIPLRADFYWFSFDLQQIEKMLKIPFRILLMSKSSTPRWKIGERCDENIIFMRLRHRSDTTITPDTLFESKGPFGDSRILKFLRIFGIFYRKAYSNKNQWIFNRKPMVFQQNLVKHFLAIPTLLLQGWF